MALRAQASPEPTTAAIASPPASPGVSSPVASAGEAATPAVIASPGASPVPQVPSTGPVGPPAGTPTPAGSAVTPPGSFAHEPMGFYTDTTVCIGCKACEVACKNWNALPSTGGGVNILSGDSYDNTRKLDGEHWRHVRFIEQFSADRSQGRWLMMSDVCKHCVQAGCLEVCPTGAIIRTEFDTVVIQSDVCNGCRACIGACPFGVIDINPVNDTAMKCTLCYDRMQNGMVPACAQACPTASIQFGPIAELRERATARVQQLHDQGESRARLYGAAIDEDDRFLGGLNSFFLLVDEPEVYGLPRDPQLPTKQEVPSATLSAVGAAAMGVLGLIGFRKRRMDGFAADARESGGAPKEARTEAADEGLADD